MMRTRPQASMGHSAFSTFHHAVRLYKDDRGLCRRVARFLDSGFAAAQPAIVVATPPHIEGILRGLEVLGRDVTLLQANGELKCLDAAGLLDSLMVDGRPEPELFRTSAREMLRMARGARADAKVYVYGEMVDLLWRSGRTEAALRLEVLWSQLAAVETFSLLCAYSAGSFYQGKSLEAVCALHTHVEPELLEPIG